MLCADSLKTCPLTVARRAPAPQVDVGLGAAEGDVVDKCHLDPKLAKGKRPGEGDMGKLFCQALLNARITPALTTWATIDTRITFLIGEATRWESNYGGLDKMPTGRAKCTRIITDVDTGQDEVTDWPGEDWMWPMIRLGRQRNGQAAAAAVKKEEDTTTAAALRAEQLVARTTAKLLVAPAAEKAALELNAARDQLALLSGGRRGGKRKDRKSGDNDGDGDSDSADSGGHGSDGDEAAPAGGAAPKEKGRHSGVDAGLAALLKDARDGGVNSSTEIASSAVKVYLPARVVAGRSSAAMRRGM